MVRGLAQHITETDISDDIQTCGLVAKDIRLIRKKETGTLIKEGVELQGSTSTFPPLKTVQTYAHCVFMDKIVHNSKFLVFTIF